MTKEKIIIEAGHIYADQNPGEEEIQGAKIGASLSLLFKQAGFEVSNMLFVDNYNASQNTLDIDSYVNFLKSLGFNPDKILYEADFQSDAQDIINHLEKQGVIYEDNGIIKLQKKKIHLYDTAKDKYSCALLDAALYIAKQDSSDSSVTVLPLDYKSQQKNTMKILQALGVDTSSLKQKYFQTPDKSNVSPLNSVDAILDSVNKVPSMSSILDPKLQDQNLGVLAYVI
jgi:hypothetical protein